AGTPQRPEPVHASPVRPVRGEATDTRTNAQVLPGRIHVNHGFWDTYRTAWPAYVLLYPELTAELADGFVQQYREGGWIARWSSPGYADCMTGTSSDVAFADAHVKGVALPDPRSAYESGLRNATVAPPFLEVGRTGNERAVFTGYVDTDTPESVSWALEAYINDHGLAAQAGPLAEAGRTARGPRRAAGEAGRVLLPAGASRPQGHLRSRHPRDGRGPRSADGPVRDVQPALAPHPLPLPPCGRPASGDGDRERGSAQA